MRIQKLFGIRLKDDPKDAELISHKLLIRGGFIRQNAAGIYSYMPLMTRVMRKIEEIIREEMNGVDGQELLMPLSQPKEMWEKTGRYQTIREELLRFKDRWDKEMVLAMTHEEAVSYLAKTDLFSYRQLPFMVYQIQLKFRDEPRCRGGLIRVREFTMKDAYSFHRDEEDLKEYYKKVYDAYDRIFKRSGLKNFIGVKSDTGMMGGREAHEFMLLADSGEDTLIICDKCGYKANKEVAVGKIQTNPENAEPLTKVATPGTKTIDEVAAFLKVPTRKTAKAVFYADEKNNLVFVVVRGDREVNETKLKKIIGSAFLRFAEDAEIRAAGAVPGYASLLGIDPAKVRIFIDRSVAESANLVVGANEEGYHMTGFNWDRDGGKHDLFDIASVEEGDGCPDCGAALRISRGIEIGNIFQLGDKYTKTCDIRVLDEQGKTFHPIMGCYGIGVGRLAASVIEEGHDQYGMIWPISVAPYELHLIALNQKDKPVLELAESLYAELTENGVEVLYDDRNESPGIKFSDADLIGCPFQMIVSAKLLEEGNVEIKTRRSGERRKVKIAAAVVEISTAIQNAHTEYI